MNIKLKSYDFDTSIDGGALLRVEFAVSDSDIIFPDKINPIIEAFNDIANALNEHDCAPIKITVEEDDEGEISVQEAQALINKTIHEYSPLVAEARRVAKAFLAVKTGKDNDSEV